MRSRTRIPLVLVLVLTVCAAPLLALPLMMLLGSDQKDEAGYCTPDGTAMTANAGWVIPLGEAYRITSRFGGRNSPITGRTEVHTGIDLASGSRRAPVLAATAGRVARITDLGGRSYGLWIEVDHGGGITTRYAHLRSVQVRVGDQVATGQQIAVEGGSGGVTGPHLHFEVRVNGKAVDPAIDLRERAGLSFDGNPGAAAGTTAPAAASATVAVSPELIDAVMRGENAGVDRSASLTELQRRNAAIIIQEGQKLGLGPRAWAIALATALQESTLGADTRTQRPNGDGDVGVFQQRALVGWYANGTTVQENTTILNDVATAARTFYLGHDVGVRGGAGPLGYHIPGLVNITGWEDMPIWQAAQRVQVSAFPLYYARHTATVRGILTSVPIDPTSYTCSSGSASVDPGAPVGEQVVAHAMTQLGVPYSWMGGDKTGPTRGGCCSPGGQSGSSIVGFDCSGLVLWAWAQVGVNLPHQSAAQKATVTPIPVSDIRAGDLLFFPGHVGIADGKGGMIEAPRPGVAVRVTPNVLTDSYYGPRFTGAGRPNLPSSN